MHLKTVHTVLKAVKCFLIWHFDIFFTFDYIKYVNMTIRLCHILKIGSSSAPVHTIPCDRDQII